MPDLKKQIRCDLQNQNSKFDIQNLTFKCLKLYLAGTKNVKRMDIWSILAKFDNRKRAYNVYERKN